MRRTGGGTGIGPGLRARALAPLTALAFLIAACGTADPHPQQTSVAGELLALVNQARASGKQCGDTYQPPVPALKLESRLVSAAAAHSEDMLAMGKLTHTGSDGSNPGQRIARTGYSAATWGENAARGYPTVEAVMAGWLGSAGHCRNLMNAGFTEFGAGKAETFWTQVFARPK